MDSVSTHGTATSTNSSTPMQRPRASKGANAKVRAAFEESKMTQGEFASAAGIAQSRLNNILQGANVTERLAIPFVRWLQKTHPGASVDWLYDDRLPWPPPPPVTTPGIVLSDEERDLIGLIREIGVPLARRRLLGLPGSVAGPENHAWEQLPSQAHPENSVPPVGRKRRGG